MTIEKLRKELETIRVSAKTSKSVPLARLSFLARKAKEFDQPDLALIALRMASDLLIAKGSPNAGKDLLRRQPLLGNQDSCNRIEGLSKLERQAASLLRASGLSLMDLAEALYGENISALSAERRAKNVIARIRAKLPDRLVLENGKYRFFAA
jgi:hypothetical protein